MEHCEDCGIDMLLVGFKDDQYWECPECGHCEELNDS